MSFGSDPPQVTLVVDPGAPSCSGYPGYHASDTIVIDHLGGTTYSASFGADWLPTNPSAGTLSANDGAFWSWDGIPVTPADAYIDFTYVPTGEVFSLRFTLVGTDVETYGVCLGSRPRPWDP